MGKPGAVPALIFNVNSVSFDRLDEDLDRVRKFQTKEKKRG